jgi:DNA-directed RNA polymerase specialized sigma24 family protein
VLLQTVRKPHLHEKIRGHTDEVTMRILKGLPGFKFNSTLDTWRTTVVRHTMYGLLKRKKSDELLALPFSLLAGEDGREIEGYELALADDGLTLQASMERAEQDQQYREIIELAIAQQPDTAAIVRMLLEGLPPRAIAARLPVTAAKVSRDKHAFIRRVRRIWREIGADGIAIGF